MAFPAFHPNDKDELGPFPVRARDALCGESEPRVVHRETHAIGRGLISWAAYFYGNSSRPEPWFESETVSGWAECNEDAQNRAVADPLAGAEERSKEPIEYRGAAARSDRHYRPAHFPVARQGIARQRRKPRPLHLGPRLAHAGHLGCGAQALTSDAIAQERRAGTLPLLFATPLTARSIVLAKSCVHMSRVLFFWLATVPPLLVPILFGGVTSLDIISSVSIELSVALVALGAGVAASAWIKHPLGALLAAEVLAVFAVSLTEG